ncbi:MAG: hypothetical protein PUF71_09400 [Firmicutes bacterium]|nr:hypothetical protein [Bacillota bacterium]
MNFIVRFFLGEKQVEPSDLPQITISNPTVDRIVNDIVDRVEFEDADESA